MILTLDIKLTYTLFPLLTINMKANLNMCLQKMVLRKQNRIQHFSPLKTTLKNTKSMSKMSSYIYCSLARFKPTAVIFIVQIQSLYHENK